MFKLKHCIFILWFAQVYSSKALHKINPFRKYLELLIQEPPLPLSINISRDADQVQELYFRQKLDHFDASEQRTWQMRYMRNDRYFIPGGPIFIFVGGEWAITKGYLVTGHMHDMAKKRSGMLFYVEHRFYGNSWPLNTTSAENLRYLNVRQSLADMACFITEQKAQNRDLQTSKVVLTGGSYAGSMVAWLSKLYPQILTAGWASSAPMFVTMDFSEFMEAVGAVIAQKGGADCYTQIEAGMQGLAQLLQFGDTNDLITRLRVCNTFNANNPMDITAFFEGIGNYFAALVQSQSAEISSDCDFLTSQQQNGTATFINFLNYILWRDDDSQRAESCLDLSFAGMRQLFTASSDRSRTMRQWFYQTCNEFGWYITTAYSVRHPFTLQVPLEYYQQLCQAAFGASYTLTKIALGIRETNNNFPGVTALEYGNVFFSHGDLDPWRAVGFQNGINSLTIPDVSHTPDLASIKVSDTVALNLAKLRISNFIRLFLRN